MLFCELFEHLYWNPFHTLKEIFRVLRPGGLLVLTTPNWRRAETLFRWLHDWGAQPPVSRPYYALFPSLLYHRHNREYTGSELDYYLARQGKDLYDFRLDGVHYSDCLDDGHEIPTVRGQRVSRPSGSPRASSTGAGPGRAASSWSAPSAAGRRWSSGARCAASRASAPWRRTTRRSRGSRAG